MEKERPTRTVRTVEEEAEGGDEGDSNWIVSYADMMTLLVGFFALIYSFSQVDKTKFEQIRKEVSQQFGGKFETPFEDLEMTLQEIIKKMRLEEKVRIERDPDSVSIIFQGSVFFDPGSVEIKADARSTLDQIVVALKEKATGYPLFIEGHTDDSPIATSHFPSNWELSAGRASRVIRILEDNGFDHSTLSAQGFSDTRPLLPNRDTAGSPLVENQSKNRRVVMRVTRK